MGFSSLVSSFKVDFFALKVLLDRMARIHCPLVQLVPVCIELLLVVLSVLVGLPYFSGGGVSLGLLSSQYGHLT